MSTTDDPAKSIAPLVPQITALMHDYMRTHYPPVAPNAVQWVLQRLGFADRSRKQQLRFLFFAAPVARRVVLEQSNDNNRIRIGKSDVSFGDIKTCMRWIIATDEMCARMIELHYFCGVSVRETAAVVRMSPHVVIRDLRSAKNMLLAGPAIRTNGG